MDLKIKDLLWLLLALIDKSLQLSSTLKMNNTFSAIASSIQNSYKLSLGTCTPMNSPHLVQSQDLAQELHHIHVPDHHVQIPNKLPRQTRSSSIAMMTTTWRLQASSSTYACTSQWTNLGWIHDQQTFRWACSRIQDRWNLYPSQLYSRGGIITEL